MAMVAILSMSLYASLHVAFKAQRAEAAVAAHARAVDIAMNMLRDDIENAMVPNGVLAGTFVGTDSRDRPKSRC